MSACHAHVKWKRQTLYGIGAAILSRGVGTDRRFTMSWTHGNGMAIAQRPLFPKVVWKHSGFFFFFFSLEPFGR